MKKQESGGAWKDNREVKGREDSKGLVRSDTVTAKMKDEGGEGFFEVGRRTVLEGPWYQREHKHYVTI